jgi:hypothetical protein
LFSRKENQQQHYSRIEKNDRSSIGTPLTSGANTLEKYIGYKITFDSFDGIGSYSQPLDIKFSMMWMATDTLQQCLKLFLSQKKA